MRPPPARRVPDAAGRYGPYGGRYAPETLVPALVQLERAFDEARADPAFRTELDRLLRTFAGRPTPLYEARRLSAHTGLNVTLKREDLLHTGAHKINNTLGQALLTRRMGKSRVIAETGAGQHGVATATACALLDLACTVYMGAVDIERQALNVFRMRLLGAEVVPVQAGSATLKDAINEAMRDWVATVEHSHYILGSVVGPHPFPYIVRELQRVIGEEARAQHRELTGADPEYVVACVGGGSNAMGTFQGFTGTGARLVGVEAGGYGVGVGAHGATLTAGSPGVLHGALSYLLQDDDGQVIEAHSVSAGLDYPGVGPEHSYFKDEGIASYTWVTDAEALAAVDTLARLEGIIPALEPAHAIAWLLREAGDLPRGARMLVTLSGRGDKDVHQIAKLRDVSL